MLSTNRKEEETMPNKLLVLSADGLVKEDVDALRSMKNFRKYFSRASGIERVRSIYPTITYPCHTTMCTGVWPEKHGVSGNLQLMPGSKKTPWKWFRTDNLWPDDIFFAAKRRGLSTGAVFWPATGNHPAIDYLVDEYWPQSKNDPLPEVFRRSGSSEEVLRAIEHSYQNVPLHRHPETTEFIMRCAVDLIDTFQPDVLFLHPADIDAARHQNGVFNDRVDEAVAATDGYIGMVMEALDRHGLIPETNVVLTSDHGLIDVKQIVNVNVRLAEAGLLDVDEDGNLLGWRAYCQSGGTSALVYLNQDAGPEGYDRTYSVLKEMKADPACGIGRVFTEEECRAEQHFGGEFFFVLETDGSTAFGDDFCGPLKKQYDITDYRYGHATHGHLPDKGPQPVFWCIGPDFRENVVLPEGRLIDQAPTYAKILGTELKDCDGCALTELLR